jgi:hypothetical protein
VRTQIDTIRYSTRVKIPQDSTISNLSILDNTGYLYASSVLLSFALSESFLISPS